jgi:catechol 2,3-dioxygenase-like lactoylglutathione lyase family enzyme
MRIDHIAYRVKDRHKTAKFFIEAMGYSLPKDLPEGFEIEFEDGSKAQCLVLEPPEKIRIEQRFLSVPWVLNNYHVPPEIFISDGSNGSIVKDWVEARNGVGGVHHIAYQVDSVENTMEEWRDKGYAEFTTDEPLTCPGLTQAFTKPSELTGIIYEFIEREAQGFCQTNVKDLMVSTRGM